MFPMTISLTMVSLCGLYCLWQMAKGKRKTKDPLAFSPSPLARFLALSLVFQRRGNECLKQRVEIERLGLELGVELAADKPGMAGDFHHLHQVPLLVDPRQHQPFGGEWFAEGVVKLIAMAVPLENLQAAVRLVGKTPLDERAGVGAEPHGSPLAADPLLLFHQVNDRIGAVRLA